MVDVQRRLHVLLDFVDFGHLRDPEVTQADSQRLVDQDILALEVSVENRSFAVVKIVHGFGDFDGHSELSFEFEGDIAMNEL